MERAGVEERRRAGAEAAALVEVVKPDHPVFTFGGFFDEETHGNPHPEKLRGFQTTHSFFGFVDDEVAVVERLDTKKIEIHIGRRVEGIG